MGARIPQQLLLRVPPPRRQHLSAGERECGCGKPLYSQKGSCLSVSGLKDPVVMRLDGLITRGALTVDIGIKANPRTRRSRSLGHMYSHQQIAMPR